MVLQQKQLEHEKQIQQIQELEEKLVICSVKNQLSHCVFFRSELFDKCKSKYIELEAKKWKEIEEKAERMKAEVRK